MTILKNACMVDELCKLRDWLLKEYGFAGSLIKCKDLMYQIRDNQASDPSFEILLQATKLNNYQFKLLVKNLSDSVKKMEDEEKPKIGVSFAESLSSFPEDEVDLSSTERRTGY